MIDKVCRGQVYSTMHIIALKGRVTGAHHDLWTREKLPLSYATIAHMEGKFLKITLQGMDYIR